MAFFQGTKPRCQRRKQGWPQGGSFVHRGVESSKGMLQGRSWGHRGVAFTATGNLTEQGEEGKNVKKFLIRGIWRYFFLREQEEKIICHIPERK